MALKKKVKEKKANVKIVTPIGRLSYPYLNEPDEGRTNSDGKYKCDLLIPKDVWKKEGKALKEAVLEVGRKFFKDNSLELSDFAHPFKDTDKIDKYSDSKEVKGCILIRCKSEFQPMVVGPDKKELSEKDIKNIKGGDYARLVVAVYPYPNQDGGVTLGLNLVQYVRSGESLGGGKAAALAQIDEIEIEADDIELDEEHDDEDVTPKKKAPPKKKPEPVEEDEEEDFDDEEEEEDEPAPKKKAKPAAKKAAPAKSKKKPAPVEEDEDEDEEEEDDFDFDDDDF